MGLGMLGYAVAGGLEGLGTGVANLANKYIERETEQLKQQRLNEWEVRKMGLEEQIAVRKDNRTLINALALKQGEINLNTNPDNVKRATDAELAKKRAELGFNTDPGNVKLATDAELQKQRAKDAYAVTPEAQDAAAAKYDSEHPYAREEMQAKILNYESEIAARQAQATNDQEKQALETQKKELDALKYAHGAAAKQIEAFDKARAEGTVPEDDAGREQWNKAYNKAREDYNALDNKLQALISGAPGGGDPGNGYPQPVVDDIRGTVMGGGGKGYGQRPDGSEKGKGYFGELPMQDGSGKVATEITIGVDINGKQTNIPALVPTLNEEQKGYLLKGGDPRQRQDIVDAAARHAIGRIEQGLSPYADGKGAANAGAQDKTMLPVADKPAAKPEKMTHPGGAMPEDQAKAFGALDKDHKALINELELGVLDAKKMRRLALVPVQLARSWGRDKLLKMLETGDFPATGNRVG